MSDHLDRYELEWWRSFRLRFREFPRIGCTLGGVRLVLAVEDEHGNLVRYRP